MAKRLYFGNLSWETTDNSLKAACSAFGTVTSATVITDKMTGRSKGFGFVEMSSDEEANKVIDSMNGKNFEGRDITVNEARPKEDRPEGGFGGSRGGRMGGGMGGGMGRGRY